MAPHRVPPAINTSTALHHLTHRQDASSGGGSTSRYQQYLSPRSPSSEDEHPYSPRSPGSDSDQRYQDGGMPMSPSAQDYVLAMHDFAPVAPNATCLSFLAGQVIHVLNRDPSGWWDGELDGQRGWFPSNYVNTETSPMALIQSSKPRNKHRAKASEASLKPNVAAHSRSSSTSSYAARNQDSCPPLMMPILHSLSLLHNAVRSNRMTHFQPSTACVISCVRSVLSATECLRRDSPILAQHPALGTERKAVLSELAKLVNQARKASDEELSGDVRNDEMAAMLDMGDAVFAHVKQFLAIAVQCGVELPERRVTSPRLGPGPSEQQLNVINVLSSYSAGEPRSSAPTTTSFDQQPWVETRNRELSTSAHRAKSMTDLQDRHRGYERSPRDIVQPSTPSQHRRRGSRSAYNSPDHDPVPDDDSDSRENVEPTPYRWPKRSIGSASSRSSMGSSNDAERTAPHGFPTGPTTTHQVLLTLRTTHDRLLSIIAAFIGRVHSYTRDSHAASKGHLFEMTKETVEQVRHLLALVESVIKTPEITESKPREVVGLEAARSTLFDYISDLVTAIGAMTFLPTSGNEEDEKQACLRAATGALRAERDCVTAVKLCLSRRIGEDPFVINIVIPPLPNVQQTNGDGPIPQPNIPNDVPAARGKKALSYLGRTTTSLNTLHEQYQQRGAAYGPIEEDLESPESQRPETQYQDDTVRVTGTDDDLTVQPSPVENPISREASLGSSDSAHGTLFSVQTSSSDTSPRTSADGRLITESPMERSEEEDAEDFDDNASSTVDDYGTDTEPEQNSDNPASATHFLITPPYAPGAENGPASASPSQDKVDRGELPNLPRPSMDSQMSAATYNGPYGWVGAHDYDARDVAFNVDGLLTGATLDVLVERMTPHNATPDPPFAAAFYISFRLFTTPTELFEVLTQRYDLKPPFDLPPESAQLWQDRKVFPIRLRIANFIKTWLELYWRPDTDNIILPLLTAFIQEQLSTAPMLSRQAQRLFDLIKKRSIPDSYLNAPRALDRAKSADRLRPGHPLYAATVVAQAAGVPPTPVMNKTLFTSLRTAATPNVVNVTDFDAVELARQLTLMESKLYCQILPEEILELGQDGARPAVHVKAISTLSTAVTGWVTECILNEQDARKRTSLIKFFIKVADRCLGLCNFSTMRSILAALDSSTIARLHKTWTLLSNKSKAALEAMRKITDHSRNHAEYRSRLRGTTPPAVPFLGLYLTDVTFCREGNPSHRQSPMDATRKLLNFNKYYKLARIVQDMQRFQIPFNLLEIPEVQNYLRRAFDTAKSSNDLHDLYRRSLLVEPRQANDQSAPSAISWINRSAPTPSPS